MADRFLRTVPRHAKAALWLKDNFGKFRDAETAWEQILDLRNKMNGFLSRPIPLADAVKRFRKTRNNAFEGITLPGVAEAIFRVMTRSPNGADFDRTFDRNRPAFVLGLIPDSIIDAAAERLIEPETVLSLEDQAKEKKTIEKKIADAKKVISTKIPSEVLGPLGAEDFYRSDVWEAYADWRSLAGQMDMACDPWGMAFEDGNPFRDAWDYLQLRISRNDRPRYTPASFEPLVYQK